MELKSIWPELDGHDYLIGVWHADYPRGQIADAERCSGAFISPNLATSRILFFYVPVPSFIRFQLLLFLLLNVCCSESGIRIVGIQTELLHHKQYWTFTKGKAQLAHESPYLSGDTIELAVSTSEGRHEKLLLANHASALLPCSSTPSAGFFSFLIPHSVSVHPPPRTIINTRTVRNKPK